MDEPRRTRRSRRGRGRRAFQHYLYWRPSELAMLELARFVGLPEFAGVDIEAAQPATVHGARIDAGGEAKVHDHVVLGGVAADKFFAGFMRPGKFEAHPEQIPVRLLV